MKERIDILQQRRIEARVIHAVYTALVAEFGTERARSLVAAVIDKMAFEKGRELRALHPAGDLSALANLWKILGEGGGLDIDFIEQNKDCLHFRVTRCGYAEAYREMGIPDPLGILLSCARDEQLLKGYSDEITLCRSRTILEGETFCEFLYRKT